MAILPSLLLTEGDESDADEARRKSAVWRHPRRRELEQLLALRTPRWISLWLEDQYPVEEPDEDDPTGEATVKHPDWRRHRRLQLSEAALKRYRDRWMPEIVPGVQVVSEDVEDLVGRVFPPPANVPWELDVMAVHIRAAEQMFVEQREMDQEMGMGISELSLQASQTVVGHAATRLDAARSLGRPGYEPAVERQQVDMNVDSRSTNIELHGRVDRNGNVIPVDDTKVRLMDLLLEKGPEATQVFIDQARAAQAALEAPVDGTAVDVEDERTDG